MQLSALFKSSRQLTTATWILSVLGLFWVMAGFIRHSAGLGLAGLIRDLTDHSPFYAADAPLVTFIMFLHMMTPLRRKWPKIHRKTGYLMIGLGVFTAIGAMVYAIFRSTTGGLFMDISSSVYGILMIWAAVQTYRFGRRKRWPQHRRWGIRFSVLVIAGASQFSALALMAENAPTIIVLLTSLAVNLRMAMYSAALVPHFGKLRTKTKLWISYFLVDQSFAMSIKEFSERPDQPIENKVRYFFGIVLAIAPLWYSSTLIGAIFGSSIPEAFSLDFAVPICFIALTAPLLRTLPHILTAIVSVVGALLLAWVPYSLGLIIAAFFAMMVGAYTEQKLAQKNDT